MPTGVSGLMQPQNQPDTPRQLKLEDSYFKIKLVDAQAFFPAGVISKAQSLLFTSSVKSSLRPEHPAESLHTYTTIKKNTPFRLGVHADLTDWLPVRTTDKITMSLKYRVTRGSPIQSFVNKGNDLDLATALSVFGPGWALGIKMATIVGKLVSSLLQEGEIADVFAPMSFDLDVGTMQTGYYAIIGSLDDQDWPSYLEITHNGPLRKRGGHALDKLCYAVLKVEEMPRLGLAVFKETHWGALLRLCRDNTINALSRQPDENQRSSILWEWTANLGLVRALAKNDESVLWNEAVQIIRDAHKEVEEQSRPATTKEAFGDESYPDEWREILSVRSPQQLRWAVQDYHDLLAQSEQLQKLYDQQGK
jgi:hypothetical protein